jgi:hypothetical protein
MIGNRSPETLGGQAASPKLEEVKQTQEAQGKAGPQPVQHPKPGRKPLFRSERRPAQLPGSVPHLGPSGGR